MDVIKENLKRHLYRMCLKYPTYHTASLGERDRANYIKKSFLEYGLKVRREAYRVRGWDFKSFSFYDVTAGCEVPYAVCEYFSAAADFEGKLLTVTQNDIADIEKFDVKGRAVFLTEAKGPFDNGYFAKKLEDLGAVALIVGHLWSGIGYPHTKAVRSPYIENIATAAAGPLGALYLAINLLKSFDFLTIIYKKGCDTLDVSHIF